MASRDVALLSAKLQEVVPLIIIGYNKLHPDRELIVTCTSRPVEEQWELFKRGRRFVIKNTSQVVADPAHKDYIEGLVKVDQTVSSRIVTKLDGLIKRSKHNTDEKHPKAEAVDFGVIVQGKYIGNDVTVYYPLLDLAKKHGVVSGGTWKWKDWPHIEEA